MSQRSRATAMSNPEAWLFVLRVGIGCWFAKALWSKLTIGLAGGFFPLPYVQARWLETMPKLVAKQAAENPILWYKSFLETTVLPHSDTFAILTAWGETAAGIGLVLGLCAGLASLVALMLTVSYGLATHWMSPAALGFHYTLFFAILTLLGARVGKRWGLDGWIQDRWPDSFLTRRPWS